MTRTTLYFGSFNPIHNGHIAIAKYVIDNGLCDELWLVVSPQNPLKSTVNMASGEDRLAMANIAVDESGYGLHIKVCDAEFELPVPSYTINTLRTLTARYVQKEFSMIVGGDIIESLDQWKDYREILERYPLLVYPRQGSDTKRYANQVTVLSDAPQWGFSSTGVRESVSESSKDLGTMVCSGVYQYINGHKLYGSKG